MPTRGMNARRIAATVPNPLLCTTPFSDNHVEMTYSPGGRPVSWRNSRMKSLSLIPALLVAATSEHVLYTARAIFTKLSRSDTVAD